jgi:hypothetical protein
MSISAMKQALEFCEDIGDLCGPYPYVNETGIVSDSRKVLTALRQAIAEAEKQEPVAWVYPEALEAFRQGKPWTAYGRDGNGPHTDGVERTPLYAAPVHAIDISQECVDETAKDKHEPVAWFIQYEYRHEFLWREPTAYEKNSALEIKPLYTAPSKREWVGLAEQDVHDAFQFTELIKQLSFDRKRPEWCENFAAYIEAKLKEKNS